mgnify:CR=1 FL=1
MKLSNQTKEILKNYSQINQNILIKQGNQLKTVSAMKNIVASATVPDEFSQEIPIYNLNEYLAAMSLFKEPVLSFNDKYMTIAEEDNSSSCKYHYSDPSVIVTVDKEIKMPSIDVEVDITEDNLKKVITAAGTLGVTDLVLTGQKDSTIQLKVKDKKNKASNDFAITIGSGASAFFEFYFKFFKNLFFNIKTLNHHLNNPVVIFDFSNVIFHITSRDAAGKILMVNRRGLRF